MGDDRTARWYRLTPDRVVLGLLAVEGVLLLSEWFGWFAFNRHKGYTVLIAVAAVAGAMLLVLLWFLAARCFGCGSSSASSRCWCWPSLSPSRAVGWRRR